MSFLTTSTWGAAVLAFVAMAFGVLALVTFYEWWLDRRRQKEIRARIGTEDVIARTFDDIIRKPEVRVPAWLEPLMIGMANIRPNPATAISGIEGRRPIKIIEAPPSMRKPSTP